jgi:hypothetical protein
LLVATNVRLVPYVTVTTEFRGLPAGLGLRLFAVYDAPRLVGEAAYDDGPATGLEATLRWGRDIDEAKKLVRENASKDKMVIFAEPLDAKEASKNIDAWRNVMRRILRALHGMRLTAQQTSTDALVIVREGDGKLGAKRLLYLIRNSDPHSLMRREMGAVRP